MRLLVSVSNAAEAEAALAGGAEIIDAKDPQRGALGSVSLEVLREIRQVCGGRAPLTAALGDAETLSHTERTAEMFSAAGATLVKIGFAGRTSRQDIEAALKAVVRGVGRTLACGVVAVAYVDAVRVSSAAPRDVFAAAIDVGAAGILLDTADKDGPGLRGLMSRNLLDGWIAACRAAGLLISVAGQLSAEDIAWLAPMDIDIAGVRGAACDAGRTSQVSALRVTMLRARCGAASPQQRSLRLPVAAMRV